MSWRWIFWIVSMADAVVQILAFLFLRETYAPKILATKKKMLQREKHSQTLYTEYDEPDRTFLQLLRKNLIRPFRMLFTQPAIQAIALYRGYQYGLMYLVYVFPKCGCQWVRTLTQLQSGVVSNGLGGEVWPEQRTCELELHLIRNRLCNWAAVLRSAHRHCKLPTSYCASAR